MVLDLSELRRYHSSHNVFSADDAFLRHCHLEELYLPEGMKEIGMQGFNNCPNLKVVHLPKSMKRIADSAFYRCPSLKTVYYNGSKEDKEKITIIEPNDSNRRLMEAEWIYAE